MATKIRAAIVGYGNLGASVERVIAAAPDMDLVAIFSRRGSLPSSAPQYSLAEAAAHTGEIDVALLCMGSATDIPQHAPELAKLFTTVDTYDNHRDIPRHRTAMDEAARSTGHVAVISTGWDPGLFSLNRVLAASILPGAQQQTFWGPGISQGHSDALRRIAGVRQAVQYTLPSPEAIEAALRGEAISGAHLRQCWVVADAAEHARIEHEIRTMPDYFVGYPVEVNFIDEATFARDHNGMPHGGNVITTGSIDGPVGATKHSVQFSLTLARNPDFTAAVQVAYARAAVCLKAAGQVGAFTPLEIAPSLLSPLSVDELIAKYL